LGTKVPEELKEKYEEVILRIPLRLDKADDSLYMSADWPEGEKISICERNSERILRKTREMAEVIMEKLGNNRPKLVLQFNCLGRGREIMGERIARTEIEILQGTLGKDIPWLGWYCFGEIAPIGQKNYFHNWTDILFVVYNPLPQDTRL
jgi:hypothetical protein